MSPSTASATKKKRKILGKIFKKKKKNQDDQSVLGVALDRDDVTNDARPFSVGSPGRGAAANKPVGKPIQVVLLLMDPNSRKFELLQLEFDSEKAKVSDVLRQIGLSATENTLRQMKYTAVCDRTGMEMIASMKLSRFCQKNDVVMAIPPGLTGSETARLAKPILIDPNVEEMVRFVQLELLVGTSMAAAISPTNLQLAPTGENVRSKRKDPLMTRISEDPSKDTARGSAAVTERNQGSSFPTTILRLLFAGLAIFVAKRHRDTTSKLVHGSLMHPGEWRSRCGAFDLVPSFVADGMSGLIPCDLEASSMLQYDGQYLRYYTKEMGLRVEKWSADLGLVQCNEDSECEETIKFAKKGTTWYATWYAERDGGSYARVDEIVVDDFFM